MKFSNTKSTTQIHFFNTILFTKKKLPRQLPTYRLCMKAENYTSQDSNSKDRDDLGVDFSVTGTKGPAAFGPNPRKF